RSVPPRRVCARHPLHAGTSEPLRYRACNPPRFCVACRCEWPGGRRPPHAAGLARGLPMTEPGDRWASLRSTMQFAKLLQRDVLGPGPAIYLTTSVYSSFELIVACP
ncbi:unnamed protein product, partial [Laminaria digitata]